MRSWCGIRFSWIQPWKMAVNRSTSTASGSAAKSFTLSCRASMVVVSGGGAPGSGLLRLLLRRLLLGLLRLHPAVAGVSRLDEELRLFDLLVRLLRRRIDQRRGVGGGEEGGELAADEAVVEQLGVVEPGAELAHDLVRVVRKVGVLDVDQRARRAQHRPVGQVAGNLRRAAALERELRLEHLALRRGKAELGGAHHLSGALA